MTPDDLTAAGLRYLEAGLPIIALTEKLPNPAIHPKKADGQGGLNNPFRGSEPVTAIDWRGRSSTYDWPQAAAHPDTTGVGIPIPPHMAVVDIDGEEGAASFRRLVPEIPYTAVAKTARGLHLWFCSPHPHRSAKLGEKLDLKAHGGYVAAPPSRHPDGPIYEWLVPLVNDFGLAQVDWLPDAIEDLLELRSAIPPIAPENKSGTLDGLVRHLKTTEEGNRNDALYWAACSARDDGFTLAEALTELVPAVSLPAFEAKRTIRSAYRA